VSPKTPYNYAYIDRVEDAKHLVLLVGPAQTELVLDLEKVEKQSSLQLREGVWVKLDENNVPCEILYGFREELRDTLRQRMLALKQRANPDL